ncbi:MAG: hypothetical protein H8E44_18170 [Planctomycetes bacterium]|nr:hypothetical protein [Planctomycetota bacterium]
MATDRFDDILKRVRDELSSDEQRKLIVELSKQSETTAGSDGQRSLFDALNDRGLIGSLADAPADLGTAPEHMEGFGQDAE